jgi:ABC-type multidrug transport system fused ATPase/permease subunit
MGLFWKSMTCLFLGKSFAMVSPFVLRKIVNNMTSPAVIGASATALRPMTIVSVVASIGIWGITRIISTFFLCKQMDRITEMIQAGINRVSVHSYNHLHELDLNYHKAGSKNTVFGINRALRSLDMGLRFLLGLFAQMGVEFGFLCVALQFYCGKKYFLNMIITFLVYSIFTNKFKDSRMK